MSLFEQIERNAIESAQPLAARMRPTTLDEFVGQQHFLGPGQLLRRLIDADRVGSAIFYGPPGTGKTTLAQLLASETKRAFRQLSATMHGVKDLREILHEAREQLATGGPATLLFVDEIHRFNKSQQDALLADVEQGIVTLVGATTSNPFFAVNSALVSRSQVFQFEPLSTDEVICLLRRAISDQERGLGNVDMQIGNDALEFLAETCDGDARRALNTLEVAVLSTPQRPVPLTKTLLQQSAARRLILYDDEDAHYDSISALIKSIRGSDPDAGIYWLARMLEGGEDVRFLCRRLMILASEDVGNADPQALPLAVACSQACEFVGLPECQLILAQTVTYLACAPKSNASTVAIGEAKRDLRDGRVQPVPRHLRDSHYASASELGHGTGYQYSHNEDDAVAAQSYLGIEREYYRPVDRGFESELLQRLEAIRRKLRSGASTLSTE